MTVKEEVLSFNPPRSDSSSEFLEPERHDTLRAHVSRSVTRFLEQLDGQPSSDLHQTLMKEVEPPLLEAVLRHTDFNQSKASIMLGMNRGTLRKKLKQYGLL